MLSHSSLDRQYALQPKTSAANHWQRALKTYCKLLSAGPDERALELLIHLHILRAVNHGSDLSMGANVGIDTSSLEPLKIKSGSHFEVIC